MPSAVTGLWALTLLVVGWLAATKPTCHSVYPIYAAAGQHWRAGLPVYAAYPGLDAYLYFPPATPVFALLSYLPLSLGGVVWRWGSAAVFLTGVVAWWRTWQPNQAPTAVLGWTWLLALPSIYNGQVNVLTAGALLHGTAALARGRLNWAALWFASAGWFKLYPLAVGLLAAVGQPRLWPRLALIFTGLMTLAYLTQTPTYVQAQWADWWQLMQRNERHAVEWHRVSRDAHLLLTLLGIAVPAGAYATLQMLMAGGAALWCRHISPDQRPTWALTLGTCWMMAFGPGIEGCTYTLLAVPLAGWWCARPNGRIGVAVGLCALPILANAFPGGWWIETWGVQPFAALLLAGSMGCASVARRGVL